MIGVDIDIDLEERAASGLLDLAEEQAEGSVVRWCAGCGGPIFPEDLAAYDAWDRVVHEACRASVPRTAR